MRGSLVDNNPKRGRSSGRATIDADGSFGCYQELNQQLFIHAPSPGFVAALGNLLGDLIHVLPLNAILPPHQATPKAEGHHQLGAFILLGGRRLCRNGSAGRNPWRAPPLSRGPRGAELAGKPAFLFGRFFHIEARVVLIIRHVVSQFGGREFLGFFLAPSPFVIAPDLFAARALLPHVIVSHNLVMWNGPNVLGYIAQFRSILGDALLK